LIERTIPMTSSQAMTFQEAIRVCFNKYADFTGTASREEYWWFFLFLVLGSLLAIALNTGLAMAFSLATILPSLAAATRRLHDTGRSGWWLLISLVPLLGSIVLLVLLAQEGTSAARAEG